MQRWKPQFLDESFTGTFCNAQRCFRLNDLEEVGDGTHRIVFDMLGLFSFRDWSIEQAIKFWWDYLSSLNLTPDHVTVHPDRQDWIPFHKHGVKVILDPECMWSDGKIGGYCTEFFKDGIEIGNIVNPLGTCIDVGFGAERLEQVLGWSQPEGRGELLKFACEVLQQDGIAVQHNNHGYVLKRVMTQSLYAGRQPWNEESQKLLDGLKKRWEVYQRLKVRHADKTPQWWKDTHGVELELLQPLFEGQNGKAEP